jgi:hypothetical protein
MGSSMISRVPSSKSIVFPIHSFALQVYTWSVVSTDRDRPKEKMLQTSRGMVRFQPIRIYRETLAYTDPMKRLSTANYLQFAEKIT